MEALHARNLWDESSVVLDVRVPSLERVIENGKLVAALGKPDGFRRLGRDAVLVPGDIPGDGDDELAVDARQWNDRDARAAQALGDAADGALVVARVEQV